MERFSVASNGRLAVNEDGSARSHEAPSGPTMSAEDKIKFRAIREDWANGGCLPEGSPTPENDNELSSFDPRSQEAMQLRLTQLQLNMSLGKATKKEMNAFLEEISSLRAKKRVTQEFYDEAMRLIR